MCPPPSQSITAFSSAVSQCRGNMKHQIDMGEWLAMGTHCGVAHRMRAAVPESFDCDRGSD